MALPENIKGALDRYVNDGIRTGGFLYAVLTNDLFGALGRADIGNRINLFEICSYIHNELPMMSWGSKEKVKEWLDKFKEKEAEDANTD